MSLQPYIKLIANAVIPGISFKFQITFSFDVSIVWKLHIWIKEREDQNLPWKKKKSHNEAKKNPSKKSKISNYIFLKGVEST